MSNDEAQIVSSSGNVFADLGLPDADEHLLKAEIVVHLKRLIAARELTQTKAAALLGIAQGDLSNVLRGRYRGFTVERLMRLLTGFDQDVEIHIKPRADRNRPARIAVMGNAMPG